MTKRESKRFPDAIYSFLLSGKGIDSSEHKRGVFLQTKINTLMFKILLYFRSFRVADTCSSGEKIINYATRKEEQNLECPVLECRCVTW